MCNFYRAAFNSVNSEKLVKRYPTTFLWFNIPVHFLQSECIALWRERMVSTCTDDADDDDDMVSATCSMMQVATTMMSMLACNPNPNPNIDPNVKS